MGAKTRKRMLRKAARVPTPYVSARAAEAAVVEVFERVGDSGGSPVYACVVLHEALPGSEICEGFLVLNEECCIPSVWVEADGEVLDPATAITRRLTPAFDATDATRCARVPVGHLLPAPSEQWAALLVRYAADPARWWREDAPRGLARVRKHVLFQRRDQ